MPTVTPAAAAAASGPRPKRRYSWYLKCRAVGPVAACFQQRRRAAHDAGVDRPHHERPEPRIEIGVAMRRHRVGMLGRVARRGARRVEQEGVGEQPVLPGLHQVERRCQRAAVETAAHRMAGLDAHALLAVLSTDRLGDQPRTEIRRHRVEPAARDDARAVARGLRVMAIDQPAHPGRFAGDVDVVGAVRHAGRDERAAIQGERAGRAQHHGGLAGQRVQRLSGLPHRPR